ncbi:hypothetical protein [Paractinoplanes lichenicola]|uniref:Uncharacterized protein n=1 Tax=Paractinoplanes lichenicola TaxID=2802976 RepID=A0ABS1VVZ3_9ACTN|nr:hypothetical protein [Actinoplanes lichenicola]MBL7258653.1 hypothetical protein [Actinoplanes lichenicola]
MPRSGRNGWDTAREWRYDLDGWTRRERDGWSFGWIGECVSSPIRQVWTGRVPRPTAVMAWTREPVGR